MPTENTPPANTPDPDQVRGFYDEFSTTRMRGYLEHPNMRIEKALGRILPYVRSNSQVLDIGCGIGLVSERLATAAPKGRVWGCDISGKNIQTACERVRLPNTQFRVADVLEGFQDLQSWIKEPVDLAVMVDVLEHLPIGSHARFFQNVRRLMAENSTFVLTYPSPAYQWYLKREKPDELQIIDEVIELPNLLNTAAMAGWEMTHFSLEDVWLAHQYVHCVMKTEVSLWPTRVPAGLTEVWRQIQSLVRPGERFILADEDQWRPVLPASGQALPFLERNGTYWGPPPDAGTAIRELERMRASGARWFLFGSPAFWWLYYYAGFAQHLEARFRCALRTSHLIAYDLSASQPET